MSWSQARRIGEKAAFFILRLEGDVNFFHVVLNFDLEEIGLKWNKLFDSWRRAEYSGRLALVLGAWGDHCCILGDHRSSSIRAKRAIRNNSLAARSRLRERGRKLLLRGDFRTPQIIGPLISLLGCRSLEGLVHYLGRLINLQEFLLGEKLRPVFCVRFPGLRWFSLFMKVVELATFLAQNSTIESLICCFVFLLGPAQNPRVIGDQELLLREYLLGFIVIFEDGCVFLCSSLLFYIIYFF